MKVSFKGQKFPGTGTLVLLAAEGGDHQALLKSLNGATAEQMRSALKACSFTGKRDETIMVYPTAPDKLERVAIMGIGKLDAFDNLAAENFGGAVAAWCKGIKAARITVSMDLAKGAKIAAGEAAARLAFGARLRGYRFDVYHTKLPVEQKAGLEALDVLCADAKGAEAAARRLDAIAAGVELARDIITEPPNVMYPEELARRAQLAVTPLGVKVEILDVKAMEKLGMGSLLAVGRGSVRPPRLLVMQWNGAKAGQAPIAFVGKGITFDTGGISIKPSAGMEDMKWDMAGSGAVIGLMTALAGRKAKVNVVCVAALAENMPDGAACRPSDVVASMSGQTIEILNTDAEGRLVLADALWYTQNRFKPSFMIDLATLTGAVGVALGDQFAGIMSNDDDLAMKIVSAGHETGEMLWRLPLCEAFDKALDSDIADIKNISGDRHAGSSIGGQFLKRFVNNVPWAHLDIASLAWAKKDKGIVPKGATGYGVRLLDAFVATNYEKAG